MGFYDYNFSYLVKYESTGENIKDIEFNEAFSMFTQNVLGLNLEIDPNDTLCFENNLSFEEILDKGKIDENKLKSEFKRFLYMLDYPILKEYAESIRDWDYVITDSIWWSGTTDFPKNKFEVIWKEFKELRFKEMEKEEK